MYYIYNDIQWWYIKTLVNFFQKFNVLVGYYFAVATTIASAHFPTL